jgi:hypothetical protein
MCVQWHFGFISSFAYRDKQETVVMQKKGYRLYHLRHLESVIAMLLSRTHTAQQPSTSLRCSNGLPSKQRYDTSRNH